LFAYNAYGLKIRSDLPLPLFRSDACGLENSTSMSVDVFIHVERDHFAHRDPQDNENAYWEISCENAILTIKGLGTFHIRQGREITIHAAAHFDEKMIQTVIINSVMAIVLFQRKMLVLHASSVRVNGSAVAFLGTSGAGKSLIAGALCARGHSLVTDDVARVQLLSGLPHVYPGYPMIKMKPHESSMLGFPDYCNRLLHEKEQRNGCSIHDGFTTKPCPLSHIFVLAVDEERSIQSLYKKESFMELIKNSAPAIWNMLPDERHFSNIKELIEKVPVSILKREECLEALPEHARMIEKYLQQAQSSNSTRTIAIGAKESCRKFYSQT
jgi:hypothetical protein